MRHLAFGFALLVLLGAAARPATGQTIRGVAFSVETRQPMAGVRVVLIAAQRADTIAETRTDARGAYTFRLDSAGYLRVRATAIGHGPVLSPPFGLAGDEAIQVNLTLSRADVVLDEMRIVGQRGSLTARDVLTTRGFDARVTQRRGMMLDSLAIADLGAQTVTDLLWGGRYSLTIERTEGVGTVVSNFGRGCTMKLVLDGFPMNPDFDPVALLTGLPVSMLHGIEVYLDRVGGIPAELLFASHFDENNRPPCGVVSIWRKSGR